MNLKCHCYTSKFDSFGNRYSYMVAVKDNEIYVSEHPLWGSGESNMEYFAQGILDIMDSEGVSFDCMYFEDIPIRKFNNEFRIKKGEAKKRIPYSGKAANSQFGSGMTYYTKSK